MKKVVKKPIKKKKEFISEYNKIVNSNQNLNIIKTEWFKSGDYFQKFSIYDNSYRLIRTLGSTTLIKDI